MVQQNVIGLDIGTTSAKAVLFNSEGHTIAESESSYPTHHPQPTWSEQDPNEIEQAAAKAIRNCMEKSNMSASDLRAIGMSAAMHSFILVDRDMQPLTASITWADGRSADQAERLKREHGYIYTRTGTPLHPMSPLSKAMWFREQDDTRLERAYRLISIKEYILYKWLGTCVVDYSVASATGLFNVHDFRWDEEALQLAGLHVEQLSEVVSPFEVLEGLPAETATRLGVHAHTPIVVGASDGPLANLGIGAIEAGEAAVTVGTSGAIRQMTNKPDVDDHQRTFCYAFTDSLWIVGGPTNNGAVVLQWMKETFGQEEVQKSAHSGEDAYEFITRLASEVPIGANGLYFLPYLNGERAPHWNARARGSFIGLHMAHEKAHMYRAGMEGVMYNLYSIADTVAKRTGPAKKVYASGGFARSSFWLQMMTDIFGTTVSVPQSHQSSAWGAAWVALYALGEVNDLVSIKHSIPMQAEYRPEPGRHTEYDRHYHRFRALYDALKEQYALLNE